MISEISVNQELPIIRRLELLFEGVALDLGVPLNRDRYHKVAEGLMPLPFSWERSTTLAEGAGLVLHLARGTLREIARLARPESPVLIVDAAHKRAVMVLRATWFRCDVRDEAHSWRTRVKSLEKWLEISPEALVDYAVLSPRFPMESAGRQGVAHGDFSHGGGHGEKISPTTRLLQILRSEGRDIRALFGFSVVSGILYLAAPLTADVLVSNIAFGTQQQPFVQALLVLASALFVCLAVSATIRIVQHCLAEVIQKRIFVRVVGDLALRIPQAKASAFEGIYAPSLMNHFNDVVTIQKSSALMLLEGINLVLSALVGMVVLAFYHPFLLAFDVLLIVSLAIVVGLLGRGAIKTSVKESKTKHAVAHWLEELTRHPNVFKSPGGGVLAASSADRLARDYLSARTAHFRVLLRQIIGLLVLQVGASSILLTVGGLLVMRGELTLGQLVASEIIVVSILSSFAKLGKHFESWYDAAAAADKLGYLVDIDIERETGEPLPQKEARGMPLQLKEVSFKYGATDVFSGVNCEVQSGEKIAVVSTEGGGGSTFLDLIYGLQEPTDGTIFVDGVSIDCLRLSDLRSSMAFIRDLEVIDGTILDNIRLGRTDIALTDVQEALRQVDLLETVHRLPDGLNSRLVTGGRPLSATQRLRLIFARAIATRPRLLLVDANLERFDPASFDLIMNLLVGSEASWTALLVTRDPRVIERCSRTIHLGPIRKEVAHE